MTRKGRLVGLLAVAAAATLTLAACSSSGGGTGGDSKTGTLTLWHYEGANSAMGIAWNDAIKKFEATHPGVKVKFEEKGFEQIQQTAQMILNSDQAPGHHGVQQGQRHRRPAVVAGAAHRPELRGHQARLGQDAEPEPADHGTLQRQGRHGLGQLVRHPELRRVRHGLLQQEDVRRSRHHGADDVRGVRPSAMDTFVTAGITPLSVGGAEYPAQQVMYQLALSKADRSWIDDYQLYKGKVDFHDPAFTYGANTFVRLGEEGLHRARVASGIKAEDMGVAFSSGKYPMMISGSWWYGRFKDEIKNFDWGTFLFPGNKLTPGSSGNLWVVPKGSKHKSLAYDFIDITMSPEIQNLLGNSGGIPVAADTVGDHRPEEQGADRQLQHAGQDRRPGVLPGLAGPRLLRRARGRRAGADHRHQVAGRDARRDRQAVRREPQDRQVTDAGSGRAADRRLGRPVGLRCLEVTPVHDAIACDTATPALGQRGTAVGHVLVLPVTRPRRLRPGHRHPAGA